MDADSSYGGSDTAQDFHSGHSSSLENATHHTNDVGPTQDDASNSFYHKNEITLPINYDEADYQNGITSGAKEPHYLSTAKLNVNEATNDDGVHNGNLEEMSRNHKSTNYLYADTSASPPLKNHYGLDNPAFEQEDNTKCGVKSTFDSKKPYNGDLNNSSLAMGLTSPSKMAEAAAAAEAVNLELINLKPTAVAATGKDVTGPYENGTNGMTNIPLKKEAEVEIGNPYDEYFVPVNEHRKYMRGEKLYVTMDKRSTKNRNKCLCWGICLAIAAAAVIIGILTAVGVIGKQDAHPIQEVSARNVKGDSSNNNNNNNDELTVKAAGGIFGLPTDFEETTKKPEAPTYPPTPGLPVSTVSNVPPSTETSMIEIPRALESQLVIDNIEFMPEFTQKNSTEYQRLANSIETELKNTLFSSYVLNYGAADINVKVIEFTPGSVVVKYRITWNFKAGIHNAKDPIDQEMLKKKMMTTLQRNSGFINHYHIADKTIMAEKILDLCKIENNGCEYSCSFDYAVANFVCTCPPGKLVSDDLKTCINQTSTSTMEPEMVTDVIFEMHHHHNMTTPSPEPTPEPSPEPEPTSEPEPEPKSKPALEPELVTEKVIKSEANAEKALHNAEEPRPEPTSEPNTSKNIIDDMLHHHVLAEPASEPITDHPKAVTREHYIKLPANQEQTTNIFAENPKTESIYEVNMATTIPTMNSEHMGRAFIDSKPEPTSEPNAEPITEEITISQSNKQINAEPTTGTSVEPKAEPTPEPVAEPTSEPQAEPITELDVKFLSEPITEVKAEPTSEPIAEATAEPASEPNSDSVIRQTPLMEFTVKPVSESKQEILNGTESSTETNINILQETNSEVALEALAHPTTLEILTYSTTPKTIVMNDTFKTEQANTEAVTEPTAEPSPEAEDTTFVYVTPSSETDKENMNTTDMAMSITLPIHKKTDNVSTSSNKTVDTDISALVENKNMSSELDKNITNNNTFNLVNPQIYEIIDQNSTTPIKLAIEPKHVSSTTDNIHELSAELTENTNVIDNMSPFLPEIDNDTFVNGLNSYEHVMLNENETHRDDETTKINPPSRLDNDQMNLTYPKINQTEETLSVLPLEKHNNKTFNKPTFDKNDFVNETTTKSPEKTNETILRVIKPKFLFDPSKIDHDFEITTTMKTITNNSEENSSTLRIPSDIINNVHSNKFFENLQKTENNSDRIIINQNVKEITTTNSINVETENPDESNTKNDSFDNFKDLNASTEDLIALETTTNSMKINENKESELTDKTTIITTTDNEIVPITVNGEIIETVKEFVHFNENSTSSIAPPTTTTMNSEMKTMQAETDLNATTTTQIAETTTVPLSATAISEIMPSIKNNTLPKQEHTYEVQETTIDITTTEKLFVVAKTTTTPNPNVVSVEIENDEDLSVVPLTKSNEIQLKQEKSSSAADIDGNLDSLDNDILSAEEESVLDKFDNNNIHKEQTKKFNDGKKNKEQKSILLDNTTDATTTTATTLHFNNLKPVTEGFVLQGFSRCEPGQFQCRNGTAIKGGNYCIAENDRCDAVDHCTDASDENGCEEEGCFNNFQCSSGHCLKRHLVCDGIQNCNDGSDEMRCEEWTCKSDEVSCGSGHRCIPLDWKCDGRKHCPNGSDETNCTSPICENDSFRCRDSCIPLLWRCDGEKDCANGEDENDCSTCGMNEFTCSMGGGCIPIEGRCNGISQCPDRSDEWNCIRIKEENQNNLLEIQSSNGSWFKMCSNEWNMTHSDLICRNLGYSGALNTKPISTASSSSGLFKLKSEINVNSHFLSQIEKTDSCDSIIALSCQEFECGTQTTIDKQTGRIIGGSTGTETQWPSLALLYNKNTNLQCTATLVAPLWALAGYSCIVEANKSEKPSNWELYAGSTKFFNNTDSFNNNIQIRSVQQIIVHPQVKFSQFEYTNDIVLIELTKPLTLTRNVSAVCLPEKEIEPRQLCIISGWGISKPGEINKEQYLHYLPVPIIEANECNSTKHYNGLMSDDKVCAGYTDAEKSPCYNDEGAPLICFSDSAGSWEVQGLLSHHDNCGRSKHPALYTAINTKMRKWIINTIGQKPSRSA